MGVVTLVFTLLAGAAVVTLTCEAPVAIATVCSVVLIVAMFTPWRK
jgi:hypothetical protein